MIRVRGLGRNGLRGYYVRGHSGSAPYGRDLICAGVSALAQGAYYALRRYGVACKYNRDDKRGILCVAVTDKRPDKTAVSDIILSSMYQGLYAMSDEYPLYLRVEPFQEVEQ